MHCTAEGLLEELHSLVQEELKVCLLASCDCLRSEGAQNSVDRTLALWCAPLQQQQQQEGKTVCTPGFPAKSFCTRTMVTCTPPALCSYVVRCTYQ
jgi:hypothetical protein